MEWMKLIQKAIEYMEEHLLDDVNYEDVARHVNMSSYIFHRTFSIVAGMTANEYIRNRRLSLAGQELQKNGGKIIDLAFKYKYDTPESFTKAFTRFHGVTPKMAKIKGTSICLFNPLKIKIILEGGKSMDYRMEEAGKRTYIALVRSFNNENMNEESNHEIPDFWKECHSKHLIDAIRELRPEGKRDLYGLCNPTLHDEQMFDYGIGVLVDEETKEFDRDKMIEAGYRIWDVEPATYAVFKCFGEDGDCISEMWNRFFKEFLPQTDYEQTDLPDYEIYFEKGEPGLMCELWIPVISK